MITVRIVVLCLTACTLAHSYGVCPNPTFIRPCTCRTAITGRQVLCRRVTAFRPIRLALNVLENYFIDTFMWHQVQLDEYLPPDFFRGVKVMWFRTFDSRFAFRPEDLPFDGLQDMLERLHMVRSAVDIANLPLDHMNKLRELDIQEQNLTEVKADWVSRWPEGLTVLRLEKCNIKKLEPYVFRKLKNLKLLSLSDNDISSLDRNMFPEQMPDLHALELKHNQLKELAPGFFEGMTRLRSVILYQNHFTEIRMVTWVFVWDGLNEVLLNDNPLQCNSSIKWICFRRTPTILEGTCSGPGALRGMSISTLTPNLID